MGGSLAIEALIKPAGVAIEQPPVAEQSPIAVFDASTQVADPSDTSREHFAGIAATEQQGKSNNWEKALNSFWIKPQFSRLPEMLQMTEAEREAYNWNNALLNHMRHK